MERNTQGTPDAQSCGCGQNNPDRVMWYPAKRVNGRLVKLANKKMTKSDAIVEAKRLMGV